MTSTILFPRTVTEENSIATNLSVVSRHATALEVCDIVYGNSESDTSLDAVERFYEANASEYENPFITATSRSVISDIYSLARQLCYVDVPKPLAMLYILLRLKPPDMPRTSSGSDSWFQGLRVWTEIGDICESESFDGHRKSIVEHTVNILFLPGLHSDRMRSTHSGVSSSSLITESGSTHLSFGNYRITPHPTDPQLPIPGTGLGVPSPFHLQLHILTRLSFNEQGRITHHRDIWDVKDVLGLVPGASLAQWIASRLAARSLTAVANLFTWKSTRPKVHKQDSLAEDLEQGLENVREMTAQYGAYANHVLDLEKISAP